MVTTLVHVTRSATIFPTTCSEVQTSGRLGRVVPTRHRRRQMLRYGRAMHLCRMFAPLFLVACGSDGSASPQAPVPTEIASLAGTIDSMVLAGGDLFCGVEKGGIVRVATATGQPSPYAPNERARTIAADTAHVAWIASLTGTGAHTVVKVAPVSDGNQSVTVADETRDVGDIALDDGFVYWTVETDVFPHIIYDVFRAAVSGGAPMKLATGVEEVSALGLDGANLYFISNGALVSLPKAGGTPQKILGNAAGLGGASQVLVDDANVTFIGNTGGGATSNFVAWVPKAGGTKTSYPFSCQGVVGLAADAASIFATCNKDIAGFKTTPALTVRKVAKGGTSVATVGQTPIADASDDRYGAVAVDATRAYIAYGNKVLATAK